MTILCRGDSLLGPANALGTRRVARLASQSPMVGSVDAPEPGFCPGARWGGVRLARTWSAANPPGFRPGTRGALARAGGLARAGLWHALAGSGTLGGLARAGGARRTLGLWRILGAVVRAGGLWRALGAVALVGGSAFPGD